MKFFRFNAGLAAILIAVALAFRRLERHQPAGRPALAALVDRRGGGRRSTGRPSAGRSRRSVRRSSWPPVVAGAAALVAPGDRHHRRRPLAVQVLTVASFLSSAALLGGTCTAMILGHWYLVIPSMQVAHLQSIVKVHIASMVVRVVVVVAAVFVGDRDRGSRVSVRTFERYIFVGRRHLLLAARAVRARGPALLVVSHVGDRENPLDAVGHRHSLRRFLHGRRRRGAGQVPAARDARARVVQ